VTSAPLLAAAADDAERHGVFTLDGFPFWAVYLVAFCIVMARAQATYWLGRGVARGLGGTRLATFLASPRAVVVIDRLHRWGPPAVTLSFLTVGVQTVVNLCAGYLRMPFGRYLVALVVGCLLWAAVWTTVGAAALYAAIWLFLLHPVALVGAAALVVAGGWWWLRRRRARTPAEVETA
jgi:membrane protein DedA with SNARE-associated domain